MKIRPILLGLIFNLILGCNAHTAEIDRTVSNNIFSSSWPELKVTVSPEFVYIGSFKNIEDRLNVEGTRKNPIKQDYYVFIQTDAGKRIKKAIVIRYEETITYFIADLIGNVKNKIRSGSYTLVDKIYQYYIKISCPTLKGPLTRYLHEKGYIWPCSLSKINARIASVQRNILTYIDYYEALDESGFSAGDFKDINNLSSAQKTFIDAFDERFLAALKHPGGPAMSSTPPMRSIPEATTETKTTISSTDASPLSPIPESKRHKIAVMKFQDLGDHSGESSLGAIVAEIFTTEVVNSNTFKIVEREQLKKVIEELKVGQSGIIDTGEARKVGKMLGAGAIITGSVMKIKDALRIDSRIIEVETGLIVGAETRSCREDLSEISRVVSSMTGALAKKFYLNPE